jgi:hypothetical protein
MSDGSGPVLPTLTFQRKLTLYHGGRVFELLELCEWILCAPNLLTTIRS